MGKAERQMISTFRKDTRKIREDEEKVFGWAGRMLFARRPTALVCAGELARSEFCI